MKPASNARPGGNQKRDRTAGAGAAPHGQRAEAQPPETGTGTADGDLGGSEPVAQAAMKQQSKTGHERGR